MLAYRESETGQIIHTGINEAGSAAAFAAAGTSYATHGEPMVPIYIFYSMFGFQRTGDAFWAAADQMTRGFVIGATAGRTTLTGEGLQHADGHSPLLAATNPAVMSYDPAFGYEIGHLVRHGLDRMYGATPENVYYYLTVYNEPIQQPAEPADVDVEGILRGLHRINRASLSDSIFRPRAQLLASGIAVSWALEAQQLLAADWGIAADVWSVTSWTELRREGMRCDTEALLHPDRPAPIPYLTTKLADSPGPVIAVSDFMRQVQDQIAPWVPNDFSSLGTDGFGFSDTRAAARRYFVVDGPSIATQTLVRLAAAGEVDADLPRRAIEKYRLLDVCAGTTGSTGGES
jgi:pyruvate dehydrogenase E1 component